jgi:glycosyltransferase involved in cell wall biosynthesis
MKIAFNQHIFNMQSYGGISRYYTLLVQGLLNQKQDVGVFAGVHQNNYVTELPNNVVKGLKLANYPPKTARFIKMLNHFLVNRQINHWKPELIHETYYSHTRPSTPSIPRVTTVYDMIHELFPQMFSAKDPTSQWKRSTFERVDHIISISHSTKKDLVELFDIDENKISVVHLGVDSSSFSNDRSPLSSRLERPFLLHVGGRGEYKNFSSVLRAMAASKHLKEEFDLVAFGSGAFDAQEQALISSLGYSTDRVRQVSGSDDKLVSLYHQATAFVYPSLYEGFGLPPLEAMASSCPVISSNTSSMPEVIGNAAEYFSPTSIEDIGRAIESVVYSSARMEELKQMGLERVQLFSWDKCALETLDVYKKIVDQAG